jgi:hypothetical protein
MVFSHLKNARIHCSVNYEICDRYLAANIDHNDFARFRWVNQETQRKVAKNRTFRWVNTQGY